MTFDEQMLAGYTEERSEDDLSEAAVYPNFQFPSVSNSAKVTLCVVGCQIDTVSHVRYKTLYFSHE